MTRQQGKTLQKHTEMVEYWNQHYPPGTTVVLLDDVGKKNKIKTRSEAWQLGSGHPVVMIEGKSGGYSLERLQVCHKSE